MDSIHRRNGKSAEKQSCTPSVSYTHLYCPISEGNHEKYVLSEGDVVVARTGATVGYAKMVGRNIPDSVFASLLVRIRPIDDEYRYYLSLIHIFAAHL